MYRYIFIYQEVCPILQGYRSSGSGYPVDPAHLPSMQQRRNRGGRVIAWTTVWHGYVLFYDAPPVARARRWPRNIRQDDRPAALAPRAGRSPIERHHKGVHPGREATML